MSLEMEDRIGSVAAAQYGIVTRTQLLEVGLSSAAIERRQKSGRLRALHRGVYLVGPVMLDRTRELAAVLAGGPCAVLSHTSAVPVWGMLSMGGGAPVHVSVPGSGRGGRLGIRFHRVALAEDERTVVDGIPITSPFRTLVDIAGILGSREVELAVAAAEREGLITGDELTALPDRYSSRPGMSVLRTLIREGTGPHFTRSEAERRCIDLLRSAGLPRPHTNVPLGPYELDLFWPVEGIALEIDGRAYHTCRHRFEGDRRKDAWLHARGIRVVRLTWRQISRDPIATAVQVGQALALARARRAGVQEIDAARTDDRRRVARQLDSTVAGEANVVTAASPPHAFDISIENRGQRRSR
jgi:very-short-patch-repair endonuclease